MIGQESYCHANYVHGRMPLVNSGVVTRPGTDHSAKVRVLIADPDERLLAAYRELLRADFELATAPCGVECVARLRERVPDVLVLEPLLLWGGGGGVLAVMRDVPELAILPVMIVTSCRDVSILKTVAPFRIGDYCVKPLEPEGLATRIRNVLHDRRLRRTVARENHGVKPWTGKRDGKVEIEQGVTS